MEGSNGNEMLFYLAEKEKQIPDLDVGGVKEKEISKERILCEHFAKEWELSNVLAEELAKLAIENGVKEEVLKYRLEKPVSVKQVARELCFVRLSNYLPTEKGVDSPFELSINKQDPKFEAARFRATIHGSTSGGVISHEAGSWGGKKVAVIIPMDQMVNEIAGYEFDDVFVVGNLKLSANSRVLNIGSVDSPSQIGKSEIINFTEVDLRKEMISKGVIDHEMFKEAFTQLVKGQIADFDLLRREVTREEYQMVANKYIENGEISTEILKPFLPTEVIANSLPDKLKISRSLESPMNYAIVKEMIKMGYLPITDGRDKYFWEPYFAPTGKGKWNGSPLEEALQDEFGHPIYESIWFKLEHIYREFASDSSQMRALKLNDLLKTNSLNFENLGVYYDAAVKQLSIGGEIWREALGVPLKNIVDIKRRIYTLRMIKNMRDRLVEMRKLNV